MPLDLRPLDDLAPAAWLGGELVEFGALVGNLVPASYDAHVRILHPPDQGLPHPPDDQDIAPDPGSWAEVARLRGTTLHAAAQWDRLTRWAREEPIGYQPLSHLDRTTLPLVVDALAPHTTTPSCCYLALWDGHGDAPRAWRRSPTFSLPGREYWLFETRLDQVVAASVELEHAGADEMSPRQLMIFSTDPGGVQARATQDDVRRFAAEMRASGTLRSPGLWWPADRAWVVASEIDLDSTVVGCSRAAADALLSEPGLETFKVEATTSLMHDGDLVNPPAPRDRRT